MFFRVDAFDLALSRAPGKRTAFRFFGKALDENASDSASAAEFLLKYGDLDFATLASQVLNITCAVPACRGDAGRFQEAAPEQGPEGNSSTTLSAQLRLRAGVSRPASRHDIP